MKNPNPGPSNITNRITGAAILLLLLLILIINLTHPGGFKNWWALLFLIPAFASINNTITESQKHVGFTFSLASNLVGVLFPIAICLILLMGLGWNQSMPIIIILAGLSMLVVGFVNQKDGSGKIIAALRSWFFSWGTAVILIGLILLPNFQNEAISQKIYFWFGTALLVAASGGLITSFLEYLKNRNLNIFIVFNLIASLVILIPGLLAIFR